LAGFLRDFTLTKPVFLTTITVIWRGTEVA
jgi:hypothetical protein